MLQIIEYNTYKELIATEGYIHRKADKEYQAIKRLVPYIDGTIDEYEEIMELPKTEKEYKAKVRKLIAQKYDIEDEIALINNKDIDDKHLNEYNEYMSYREECKIKAKELLNNKEDGEEDIA